MAGAISTPEAMAPAAASAASLAASPTTSASPTATTPSTPKFPSKFRRSRPPDLQIARTDERIPLRAEKLSRRASRLNLFSLFTKNKTAQDVRASNVDTDTEPYSFHAARSESTLLSERPLPPRTAGPGFSHLRQQASGRQTTAPSSPASSSSTMRTRRALGTPRSKTPPPSSPSQSSRGCLATWDPPPLFQAYPQAIKHAQLPTCSASIETLVRFHSSTGSGIRCPAVSRESPLPGSTDDGAVVEKPVEKQKRRHRRNTSASSMKLDWSSKIYVLVTSGYLLQYAGDGSFDRLPEKMLHIGKDSAAFASDLIPGRHWVLQVSSVMDPEGGFTYDSRSSISRLLFRGSERRHASNFLMVFEGAEEMESWITTLRREIEQLGGKKHMSETGKPKVDDHVLQLKAQPSHRTLVLRDPDRFSRLISPKNFEAPPWRPESMASISNTVTDGHFDGHSLLERLKELDPSVDDMSATNSMVSHDGYQLDNLRDNSNRLSLMSLGQRTVVTSEASSPPCSPVRLSFASSHTDDPVAADGPKEARPRPNAAAILDRRQSIQPLSAGSPTLDFRFPHKASQSLSNVTPPPTIPLPPRPDAASMFMDNVLPRQARTGPPQHGLRLRSASAAASTVLRTIPNFSVPHAASKRYSTVMRSSSFETTPSIVLQPAASPSQTSTFVTPGPPPAQQLPAIRSRVRRAPPPALAFSRPLSVVTDQPSPASGSPASPRDQSRATNYTIPGSPSYSDVPDTPALFASLGLPPSTERKPYAEAVPTRCDSSSARRRQKLDHVQVQVHASPRKRSNTAVLATFSDKGNASTIPGRAASTSASQRKGWFYNKPLRSKSALASVGQTRSPSPTSIYRTQSVSCKQANVRMQSGEAGSPSLEPWPSMTPETDGAVAARPMPHIRPMPSGSRLRSHSTPQRPSYGSCRSTSQLAEGPPPAPPPTCALPPVPPDMQGPRSWSRVL